MSTGPADEPPPPGSIVWWPWLVLAAGPLVAAAVAAFDSGSDSTVPTLIIVALLALLFLAVIFAPALILVSRATSAPSEIRRRGAIVFVVCVAAAHVLGQLIERSTAEGEESALSGLAFIGVYLGASALAYVGIRRELDATPS